MRKIINEFAYSDEQLNIIKSLARKTGLYQKTVEILYGRGIDDEEKIKTFLNPSREHFISPFKMRGMAEAKELITRARDEEWSVVVYGDYDADGVCAASIMSAALKDFGIDTTTFVPERKDGYGLGTQAIDDIFDECFPQLFITVDCGISNAEEVEYIKEQGAEVIVTDHHELPARLPDCICINPKFNDGYIYDNLCGAGVAFKVACALNGEDAYKYLDFAAIATVADSVPLTGENRDIVAEGLKLINDAPRKCYAGFLKSGDTVTAQSLAFLVAPKINAAGRMGDANAALKLFCESDEGAIFDMSAKLTAYNLERQKCCDELYASVKRKLGGEAPAGRVIMLWDESWNSGFVGIVAARLAEEYSRPALLFVKNGDMLKGSARSVEGVNIYEALRACSPLISEFGGHSQAAGVNITEENFPLLKAGLEEFLADNYSADAFLPDVYVSGETCGSVPVKFIKELELLEPCGVGNKRPLFAINADKCAVRPLKAGSGHLAIKCGDFDLTYFSALRYASFLKSAARKKLVFEYNISVFRGKEYVKGLVRDVVCEGADGTDISEDIAFNNVSVLSRKAVPCEIEYITHGEAQSLLDGGLYGAVFVAVSFTTLARYAGTDKKSVNFFAFLPKNTTDTIIVSPEADCDFSGFSKVIFLDDPRGIRYSSLAGKKVYICRDTDGFAEVKALASDRETLLSLYRTLATLRGVYGETAEEIAQKTGIAPPSQLLFALKVFEELGLVEIKGGKLEVIRGKKTALENSEIYNFVNGLR